MSFRALGGRVLRAGPAAWRRGRSQWHGHRATALVPRVLGQLGDKAGSWVAGPVLVSSTRTAVVPLGPPGSAPVAMAKLPGTSDGFTSQQREGRALGLLAAEPAVGDFARLLPLRLGDGHIGAQPFVVERAIPGIAADAAGPSAAVAAISAIRVLHERTARLAVVGEDLLNQWVDQRIDILTRATRRHDVVDRLRRRLHTAWAGRHVQVSWVHGDFWAGNVIVDPATGAAEGIIDWEWAAADELPEQDLVYALVHARMRERGAELGDVVAEMLRRPIWDVAEQALLRAALVPVETGVDPDVLLLVWLRQVAANLVQAPAVARNPVWVRRNVASVLRALHAPEPAGSRSGSG
jgi:Phosphotransferase enzyme family